jgi:hypothetical protein
MKFNAYQVIRCKLFLVMSRKWSKSLNGKIVLLLSNGLCNIFTHIFFYVLLFGFAHECEVQKSPFDLYCLIFKYSTSNPKLWNELLQLTFQPFSNFVHIQKIAMWRNISKKLCIYVHIYNVIVDILKRFF